MATARKPAEVPASHPVTRMRIWYEDGTHSAIFNPNKPASLAVFEAHHGHEIPDGPTEVMWLAWHTLGRPGADFESWMDTVEDLERMEWELGKAYK